MSLAMLLQPFLICSFVLEHLLSPCIMGRPPCCDESGVKKGLWTPEEDEKLMAYISKHGQGSWRTLPKHADLNRCGKSCRLRWANYLRPHIKRGKFTEEEERMIVNLHSVLGNKYVCLCLCLCLCVCACVCVCLSVFTCLSCEVHNKIENFKVYIRSFCDGVCARACLLA